jgi:hypothetical protein
VDCYVDADFCGLWGSRYLNDPVVTKLRTIYVVLLAGIPEISPTDRNLILHNVGGVFGPQFSYERVAPVEETTVVKTFAKIVTKDDWF